MLKIILRLVVVLAGYLLACLAASLALGLALLALGGAQPGDDPAVLGPGMVAAAPFIALFVAYFAFLPSIAIIALAEWFGWRSWLAYAFSGAAIALAVAAMFARTRSEPDAMELLPVMLASGIVAGLVYWLIAGRTSGLALEERARQLR